MRGRPHLFLFSTLSHCIFSISVTDHQTIILEEGSIASKTMMISLLNRIKPQLCFIMVGFVGLWLLGISSVQGFCVTRNHQTLVSMSSSSDSWHAQARRVTTRTPRSLSMHMGHSHSHHHHHDHSSSSSSSHQQHRVLQRHFWRRQVTLLLFCAMVTLGPRLVCNWRNGWACAGAATTRAAWWAAASSPWTTTMSLSQLFHFRTTDWTAFCVSALALSFAHPIRSELTRLVHKLQATMQQVVKHLPPLQWSNLLGLGAGPAEEEEAEAEESITSMATSRRENRRIQRRSRRRGDPAIRVTSLGVVVNLVLSIGKWVVGVSCHSAALIADAGHSLSDLVSDFVTLFAVQVARLPPDDDHPYGHGKFEALGSLFLALTLLATGLSVGAMSNQTMLQILSSRGSTGTAAAAATATTAVALPKPPALLMAGLSILSKEWLFRITRVVAQGLNSQVLLANAWHHRSDAYSSILALLSIGLAMFVPGMLAADSFAGLLVAGMICMTGADILGESINQLSDTNNEALVQQVTQIVQEHATAQQPPQQQQTNDTKSSVATLSHGDDNNNNHNHNNRVQVHQVRARQVGSQALVDVKLVTTMEQAQHCSAADTRRLEEEVRHHILTHDSVAHVILDAEVRALPPQGGGPDPWGETSTNKVQPFSVSQAATTDEQEVVASVEFPSSPVDHHDHDHDHLQNLVDDDSHDNDALKQLIRQQAMSIPDIASVESIALFHENKVAHVVVRVDDSVDRMDQAKISANQLQSTLESWKDIAKAHILIDLTMTTTTTPKDASAHSQSQSHQAPVQQQQEEPTPQPQEQR